MWELPREGNYSQATLSFNFSLFYLLPEDPQPGASLSAGGSHLNGWWCAKHFCRWLSKSINYLLARIPKKSGSKGWGIGVVIAAVCRTGSAT